MRDYYNVKINLPGGIASPGVLKGILSAARKADVQDVRFGARQQLLMTVHYEQMKFLERDLKAIGIQYNINPEKHPNIISSYCGEDVFRTGQWLDSNEYHTVFDSFEHMPELKVNISDSNQSFTPFFTGNLNFISSPEPHFWYLYVRPKQSNILYKWEELVYTNEIGKVAREIENQLLNRPAADLPELFAIVKEQLAYIALPITQELELPAFSLPYYEGFNRYESRTWLGLYRRDEQFSVEFLLDVCNLCMKTRIGEICTTPWKSIIIKGIEDQYRSEWSNILGKHNINVRHAANELAWQTEDNTSEGTQLKQDLIRYIEKNDTRTFGLCFGIQTKPKSEVFGSVLIRKRPLLQIGQLSLWSVYDLYFTENFNPNSRNHILFEKGLYKIHLAGQVERLCRKFSNKRFRDIPENNRHETEEVSKAPVQIQTAHQCPHCFTIYDAAFGDTLQNIPAGVLFQDLSDTYLCPTCDTPKAEFEKITISEIAIS
ncbi:rubredoxin [Dyadobacter luteus]|jgi:rubredoxin|uniref:Rubredoxin n=1 Tax=Dyadobacter luteus TaxID=2259619 RepID=A0A3D8YAI8_9BACT|nr:rubredoxin [Dyadobacter luteus]REA58854.1 rubredoxin [Dyadobacter luteus]